MDVTIENVQRNGVADRVRVARGTLGPDAPADMPRFDSTGNDLLLINILAEIIIAMAPSLPATLRSGGRFVASGIIRQKADDVAEALQEAGLSVDKRLDEDDWVALIGHKA
mgnify:CR=1 FL=1